jgi:UDP-glucose 4-epimerase
LAQVTITGVAGFLGSHLADQFLKLGWEVKGIDNLIGGYRSNVPEGVDFYQIDLAKDLDALDSAFLGSELVIHAACTAYEGLSVFSPSLVIQNTVQATTNALVASQRGGAKKFVYMSSMARYGDHDGKMFTEDMEPKPQDPYGIAKLASENLVRNICDTHGMDWVILVPHNIIGPRQKFDDPFRNVASIMINRMLQGKQPIIYGTGEQKRCFSFIEDVVNPIWVASTTDKASKQVVNIGPDEDEVTINQLASLLADYLDFDLDPIYMPGRPQEVPIALCSSDKARQLLNYETKTILWNGLKELSDWIQEQGAKPFTYHLPLEIITDKVPRTWSDRLM